MTPGSAGRGRAAVAAVLLLAALLPACARRAATCEVCRREAHAEVAAAVILADGRRVTPCCPRCALRYAGEAGRAPAARIEVTDYVSRRVLPLDTAYLVEGSDETPCLRHHAPATGGEGAPLHLCFDRCMPSLIAFAAEPEARAFIDVHGGDLLPPGRRPAAPPESPPAPRPAGPPAGS